MKNIAEIFIYDYNVTNVFDNDKSVIISRIGYVEKNRPSRSFFSTFKKLFVFIVII